MHQQRFNSSDSLEALVSIGSSEEERRSQRSGGGYSQEFQAMLDSLENEDCAEGTGLGAAKKRRLSTDQVRALEEYFEVENKLDPDRKVKLAAELGLQPRQVAVWFQNRRARRRTKQLERDFRLLKSNYDSLNFEFSTLEQEKKSLSLELEELKEKLRLMPDSAGNKSGDFRGNGSSDSDSDGVFKEESDVVYNSQLQISSMSSPPGTGFQNAADLQQQQQAVEDWFLLPDMMLIPAAQPHVVKMEEEGLFDSDESCNIYSVDQAPTLHWYFPE